MWFDSTNSKINRYTHAWRRHGVSQLAGSGGPRIRDHTARTNIRTGYSRCLGEVADSGAVRTGRPPSPSFADLVVNNARHLTSGQSNVTECPHRRRT